MKNILKSLFCLTMFFGLVLTITACDALSGLLGGDKKTEEGSGEQKSEVETTDIDLLDLFADGGDGVYTTEKSTNSYGMTTLKVTADKTTAENDSYAALVADLSGKDLSKMNSLRFYISGGTKVLIKIESTGGAVEVTLALSAVAFSHEWDLSGTTEKAVLAADNVKVMIFALPGADKGTGEFSLSSVALSEDAALYNPINSGYTNIKADVNNYDGVAETFDINAKWVDNDGGRYTFTEVEDGIKVDYNLSDWQFAYTPIAGPFGKFTHVTVKITGVAGEGFTLKAQGNGIDKQAQFKCTGELQVASIDLSEFTESQRNGLDKIMIFATATGEVSENTVTIHECYFAMEDETDLGELPEEEVKHNAEVAWNINNWSPLGGDWYSDGNDTFVWDSETKTVSFADRTEYGWSLFGVDVKGAFGKYTTLTFEVTATEGLSYKFRFNYGDNQNYQYGETKGTGEKQTITLNLADTDLTFDQLNSIRRIGLYTGWQLSEWDNPRIQTGSVQINSVVFGGYTEKASGADTFDINHSFYDFANPQIYNPVTANGATTVKVAKYAGTEWMAFCTDFSGGLAGYTTLNYDFDFGGEIKNVVIKLNGGSAGNKEFKDAEAITVSGTGSFDLTQVSADILANCNRVEIFFNFAEATGKGTVTINTLEFVK